VEGREILKIVTSGTKYKATMTRNDYKKNMYYLLPLTINNNAIIQIVSRGLISYLIISK